MPIKINSNLATTGGPGTYVTLDEAWSDGDRISFTLPMKLKLTRYNGSDQIAGHNRYAIEYGPILLAAVGSTDVTLRVDNGSLPEHLLAQLTQKPDRPLHFSIAQNQEIEYMPYWQLSDEHFTCFPVIDVQNG
jgi:uncharacterized protein